MNQDRSVSCDDKNHASRKIVLEGLQIEKKHITRKIFVETLELAIEIAREGREGRKVGTLFVIGDARHVLKNSRPLILDPLFGHSRKEKHISDPNLRETVKELSLLDGGFVVSGDGYVLSATRFFTSTFEGLPKLHGLGARHMAAASITKVTNSVSIAVSESSIVRIFSNGKLMTEILPELWLISRYSSHIRTPLLSRHTEENMVIFSSKENGE